MQSGVLETVQALTSKNGVVPITSSVASRGSCVSICDTSGTMLFYAATMIYSNNFFQNPLWYLMEQTL
ncbi:MAG: hypothetical protein IPP71_13630 [Bacteroidetes bacterium]|nr:hypothetical protein [Bacteroidota bacterium]